MLCLKPFLEIDNIQEASGSENELDIPSGYHVSPKPFFDAECRQYLKMWELERIIHGFPPKALDPMPFDFCKLIPMDVFTSDPKRKVAGRARRVFGPDNYIDYDSAKVCARFIKLKQAIIEYQKFERTLRRPLTTAEEVKRRYQLLLLRRAKSAFLDDYCSLASGGQLVSLRNECESFKGWWDLNENPDHVVGYQRRLANMLPEERAQQRVNLLKWASRIQNARDRLKALRTLAAFDGFMELHETDDRCEFHARKQNQKHRCLVGRAEYVYQLELLELTAKLTTQQGALKYLWPKM
ncbi:hypothetical protein DICA1_C10154 [Diutina catenulata]